MLEQHVYKATISDLPYIRTEMNRESHSIGFIPLQRFEAILTGHTAYEHIAMIADNQDRTGYVYFGCRQSIAGIWQIVVRRDARRWQRATRLLQHAETIALQAGCTAIRAKVACDLEANAFWQASQYHLRGFLLSAHGRQLALYIKYFTPLFHGDL